ncbi:lamin tail domain-containing protein [Wenzhouxiangella sp. EGI_FJ10305]|uniref:lamin tail domain-containing protein n=1 Tax=Wenzhouxiangella sp. EGI_FJ10305 TaxID=3243768 RepID=UPI0035D99D2E
MKKVRSRLSRFGILFVALLLCLGLVAPAAFGQVIFQDRFEPPCADCPDAFDHFTIEVSPSPPVAGLDFTMNVTAYRSGDDSEVMTSYDGTLSVTASSGALTGETDTQPITAGTAELKLQHDTAAEDVVLTVTDDIFPELTESLTVTFVPEGDVAGSRDVVISEINWYGNGIDNADEWIELRNISGGELNLAGWMIENAGTSGGAVILDSGTVLADGDYLVVGQMQGADVDGERTSLTGVDGVQIQTISLGNGGEQLTLRDVDGNIVDATPAGEWPAGNQDQLMSMERFDNITGGGYGDGESADSWYTWNQSAGVDTTHPASADHGTPGADNSDPFPPTM